MKISICGSCYNEANNVEELVNRIHAVMQNEEYDYEIVLADNASEDRTEEILRKMAEKDKRLKIIINNRNYGPRLSPKNALRRCTGDVVISIATDLQDPPELITVFLREYEKGNHLVLGQKKSSREGLIKYSLRSIYYKIIKLLSPIPVYEHVSGICLYDREILQELLSADADASFRILIAEMGYPVKLIPYDQNRRGGGKSSYSILRYLDFAIDTMVLSSSMPLRLATILGVLISILSILIGIVYFVYKLMHWSDFSAGIAPMVIGFFFLGGVQISFIGLIGEYVAVVLRKVTKQPDLIEKEIINFD